MLVHPNTKLTLCMCMCVASLGLLFSRLDADWSRQLRDVCLTHVQPMIPHWSFWAWSCARVFVIGQHAFGQAPPLTILLHQSSGLTANGPVCRHLVRRPKISWAETQRVLIRQRKSALFTLVALFGTVFPHKPTDQGKWLG